MPDSATSRPGTTFAVTGAGGLIGQALCARLRGDGARVIRLVRRSAKAEDEVRWGPEEGIADPARLEHVDCVIHLAGENLAAGRWNAKRMARIRDSRVHGTHAIAQAVARLAPPPRVLVCASAVGYYGDRGASWLDETSPAGTGFLPALCSAWEAAAREAEAAGVRCVQLRLGPALAAGGGMLARMVPIFRLGLGGPLGRGEQYVSWISLDDAVRAILHVVGRDAVAGPVNAVSPQPVTNRAFAKALGRAVRRPAVLPAPAFALRLAFGRMADEALLSSQRVRPAVLAASGFTFDDPALDVALRRLLGD